MADQCAGCGQKLFSGVFGSNLRLAASENDLINEYELEKKPERCKACGAALLAKHVDTLRGERYDLSRSIQEAVDVVPLASIHSPRGWDYRVLDLVTAQSTTGTGVLSDLTSSFSDFFGTQSGTYNSKLKEGEELCRRILRKQAYDAGGNAVVGVDIDYAEVGANTGMLMVCMSGTAVSVSNVDVLGESFVQRYRQLQTVANRLSELRRYEELAP